MRTSVSIPATLLSITLAAAISAAVPQPAGAQQAEAKPQAESKVMLDIGNADGPPGRTLPLPLNIAVPEGMKLTEFELDVRFEKDVISFTRADLAPQGTADEVKLTTTVEADPASEKHSILKLKGVSAKSLSSGAVADLFFRINPKAKPPGGSTGHKAAKFTTILKKDAKVKLADGQLASAGGRDGEIDITAGTAIFGCFFYMH